MTAKEHFRQLSRMETLINSKKQRMEAWKELATNVGSSNLSGMPKNPSKALSPMANAICKALDLEMEINREEISLQEKKVFLLDIIETMENYDYQTILIKRYFEHLSWINVANQMFYSIRWIYKLHDSALEEMNKKLNERSIPL